MRHSPRIDKRRVSTAFSAGMLNRLVRPLIMRGLRIPGIALLETTGRRSGQPRRTPVGDGLEGDVFWVIAEHGRGAAFVRNIEADPAVRVKVRGRWRTGVARLLYDDDPRERQRTMSNKPNSAIVRLMGSDLLSVRIDLDPAHR